MPLDARTLVFAYMVGSILSVPVAMLYANFRIEFEPPEWTAHFYRISVIGSIFLLPFLIVRFDDRPVLKRLGWIVMVFVVIGFLIGIILFPMIQT